MASIKTKFRRKWQSVSVVHRALLLYSLVVVLFNECLIYTFQSFRWWSNMPAERDPEHEIVLLLVSDPQIIGYQEEQGFPIGTMARWDSDRYLRQTFSRAHSTVKPDVIIFLGDLMDEGSIATESEYEAYLSRFRSIFYETTYTKTIYIPGDNDIGGEDDFRTPFKMNQFQKNFENMTGVVSHKFVDFLKLDIRTYYDAVLEQLELLGKMKPKMHNSFRIIVNHDVIMTKLKSMIYPVLKVAHPAVIISGHWHLSQIITCDTCLSDNEDMSSWPFRLRQLEKQKGFMDVPFKRHLLTEIMVPTCSYRMGVPHMGYGVAIIHKSGSMKYAVLWLPSRYTMLKFYSISTLIVVGIFLIHFILSPLQHNRSLFTD